jgi:hypothetical protein
MRFTSAKILPIGACFQLTVVNWYGYTSGLWPTISTHTSLDDAIEALIMARCGEDIELLDAEGKPIQGYAKYRASMTLPPPVPLSRSRPALSIQTS